MSGVARRAGLYGHDLALGRVDLDPPCNGWDKEPESLPSTVAAYPLAADRMMTTPIATARTMATTPQMIPASAWPALVAWPRRAR
ncbi:hypothetical protein QFZ49_002967 [Streptomyces turgidiscabies]|uniref:Uncharacterized protein n=1 Tax=Streptomyces turgidiscabies TaxID=85558 RepID=A0ABU0RM26_9ACTN|nr:hypothetical protein [Streptomyces turgidiscabies]